jgi:hypothetical protein
VVSGNASGKISGVLTSFEKTRSFSPPVRRRTLIFCVYYRLSMKFLIGETSTPRIATHTDTDFLGDCPVNCPTPPAFKVKNKESVEKLFFPRLIKNAPACGEASAGRCKLSFAKSRLRGRPNPEE